MIYLANTVKDFNDLIQEKYSTYGEKSYPLETAESVKRCFVPYEMTDEARKRAREPRKITKKEAISDINDFFNCMKRCYCGYDFFFTDLECERRRKAAIRYALLWPGKMPNKVVARIIYHESRLRIGNDSHFSVVSNDFFSNYNWSYVAFVSDIVVEKVDKGYRVVNSNNNFEKGFIFSEKHVSGILLPTLYIGKDIKLDDKFFLLGIYTDKRPSELKIAGKRVKLHRIKADFYSHNQIETDEKDICSVINHDSYLLKESKELLEEFYEQGSNAKKREYVILNLLGNSGGNSAFPEAFYKGLNTNGDINFNGYYLPYPNEIEDGIKKYRNYICGDNSENTYNGKLYVLMNKQTASSGEMGISPSYHMKNTVRIGSASAGCSNFGMKQTFQLPYSKICFEMGQRLFYNSNFMEGIGFLPDYWIDDEDVLSVVKKYILMQVAASTT